MTTNSAANDASDHMKQVLAAILIGCVGWAFFVFSDTTSKWLTQFYTVKQIIWTTSAMGLCIAIPWGFIKHGKTFFITPRWKWHLIRGFCVSGTAFMVVNALSHIPLADFYGIIFLSPIVIMLLSHFFLKEEIGFHRITAALIGFMGVLVIAGPQFDALNIGFFLTLGAVLFIAMTAISVRKIGDEPVKPLYAVFPFSINTIIYLPHIMTGFEVPETAHWPVFALMPPLVITGLICNSLAFERAPSTAVVAPFHYTQMIWGIILGIVLFGDFPTWATIGGSCIIIAAGLYMIWREHIHHAKSIETLEYTDSA